jgi:hypothetical protein
MSNTKDNKKDREAFEWGSYGVDGTEDIHYIKLMDLSSLHLYAILKTQTKLKGTYTEYLLKEEVAHRLLNKE